jgi:hypothetical protein
MALEGAPLKLRYGGNLHRSQEYQSSSGQHETGRQVGTVYHRSLVPRKKTPAQAELGRGTPASLFSIA